MSEEEKKAIEYLKKTVDFWKRNSIKDRYEETILNLIEKLQKERDIYYYEWKTLEADLINNDIIQKEKIRDKLDEIMSYTFTSIEERHQQNYAYDRIKELLEEK